MGLSVATNATAIAAHRSLTSNDAAMTRSLERLSSGPRINRAAGRTPSFSGPSLLDGSYSGTFQVGANEGETLPVAIGSPGAGIDPAGLGLTTVDVREATSLTGTVTAAISDDRGIPMAGRVVLAGDFTRGAIRRPSPPSRVDQLRGPDVRPQQRRLHRCGRGDRLHHQAQGRRCCRRPSAGRRASSRCCARRAPVSPRG